LVCRHEIPFAPAEQGVFPAQPKTFLSDGGETVRQAQGEFREFGEPILDSFHVAMRSTQLSQAIKGLAAEPPVEGESPNRKKTVCENYVAPGPTCGTAARIAHCARSKS
jgi:hypothetical protein